MALFSLGTVDPNWLGIIDSDRERCRRCSGEVIRGHKPREEASREIMAWILEA